MVRRGAIEADGFTVAFGGIAHVLVPTVLGIIFGEGFHAVVAIGLGEDGGRGDAHESGIPFDNRVSGNEFLASFFMIRAPSMIIAPMPTRTLSSIVQP